MPLLKRLAAFVSTLGLALLVALALLITVARVAQPLVDQQRDVLARILAEHLGYGVSIGALKLVLVGWDPRLTLEQVRLTRPENGEVALALRAMELDLDLLASLRGRAPRIEALTLVGASLELERAQDGRIEILGLGALKGGDHRAMDLFLRQGRLNLVETRMLLVDQGLGGKVLRLGDVRLSLENAGRRHLMELSARLLPPEPVARPARDSDAASLEAPSEGSRVHLVARLEGDPEDPWSWDGRAYLSLGGANLGLLMPVGRLFQGRLDTEAVSLESWHRIRQGRLEQVVIRADLAGLSFAPRRPDEAGGMLQPPRVARRMRALARLRALPCGWQARILDLAVSLDGAELSGLSLDLGLGRDGAVAHLGVLAPRLELADLSEMLRASPKPLPEPLSGLLERHPRGRAKGLALSVESSRDARGWRFPQWRVSASLSGFGLAQGGKWPGFEGLDLVVSGNQDRGELRLGSESMRLDPRPLFDQGLWLDQFSGRVGWRRLADGGWHLSGRHLVLQNADLAGRATLELDLPAAPGRPFMDLKASFQDGNGAKVRSYLPAGVMDRHLVNWLDAAIVSGRVTQGDLIFRGALADYPFRQQQGRFELLLKFEDLLFDYQRGWPAITSAAGHLRFLNQGLSIRIDRGRIYESAFFNGRADLPELRGAKRIRIHGEAEGPFADARRTLSETPLSKDLGHLANLLEVGGTSRLTLDIDLPFEKRTQIGVAGRLTWPKLSTLGIGGTPITLTALDGAVHFSERGIETKSLTATLWGQPVRLAIATEGAGDPATSITRIQAASRTPVKALAEHVPAPSWRLLEGWLDWDLAVSLRNRDVNQARPPLEFKLSSSLREASLRLPPPLGKAAGGVRNLALGGTLVPGQGLSLQGHLGDLGTHLEFDLSGAPARLVRGRLRLGDRDAPAPEKDGLRIEGSLAELDLPLWLAWSQSFAAREDQPPPGGDSVVLSGVALNVGRLSLGGPSLTDAEVTATPASGGWRVRLGSREVSGEAILPPKDALDPVAVSIERLDLKPLVTAPEQGLAQAARSSGTDPLARLPALDLRVANVRWGDALLGTLDLALRKDAEGIRLPRLNLSEPGLLRIKGDGDWQRAEEGGRSRIDLALETPDLGRFLAAFGEGSALEAREAKARVALTWTGGLTDFALRRARGFIDPQVGQGRFLEVEPGVGRLLGFLNFSALGRRLALDFSDLHGQGFAFEQMSGRVGIGQGQARFDDFRIEGPAGTVIVTGLADLSAQRFEQTVTVEPKLGSSVALASAVAGGPVVGAAIYLVDRVAGNPIDRLGRYQYRVTGPWSAPETRRIGWEPLRQEGAETPANAEPPPDKEPNHFLDVR